jgi:hypothetical protein
VATLGLCAAGWLLLTPFAFGDRATGLHSSGLHSSGLHSSGWHNAALADRATGGGLAVVSLFTIAFWVLAWRRKLRADGALPATSRRQARREARELHQREHEAETDLANAAPDPAQILSELRTLLIPLLAEPPAASAAPAASVAPATPGAPAELHHYAAVPRPRNEQESFGMLDGFQPVPTDLDDFQHAPGASDGYPLASPEPPVPSGIAAIESMLAGGELLTVGCGEEEAW